MVIQEYIVYCKSGKQLSIMGSSKAHALLSVAELFPNEQPKQAFLKDDWV